MRCRCSISSARGARPRRRVEEAMNAGVLGAGQIPARAKRVIMLHMLGAISHVDTFDYKPMLVKMHGQDLPASVRETQRLSTMSGGQSSFPIVGPLAAVPPARRERCLGQRLPAVHRRDRRRAVLREEHAYRARQSRSRVEVPAHRVPARGAAVRRRVGELRARLRQPRSAELRRDELRRVRRRSAGRRDLGLGIPAVASSRRRVSRGDRPRSCTSTIRTASTVRTGARCSTRSRQLARLQHEKSNDPEILSRVSQYEMAYRMQASIPEVADISDEPEHVLRDVWPRRPDAGHVRAQLLDRAPARRTRREIPDAVRHGLGPPSRDQAELSACAAPRSTSRAQRS